MTRLWPHTQKKKEKIIERFIEKVVGYREREKEEERMIEIDR